MSLRLSTSCPAAGVGLFSSWVLHHDKGLERLQRAWARQARGELLDAICTVNVFMQCMQYARDSVGNPAQAHPVLLLWHKLGVLHSISSSSVLAHMNSVNVVHLQHQVVNMPT